MRASRARLAAVVVLDCPGKLQIRPKGFVLPCTDGNSYLAGGLFATSYPGLQPRKRAREKR
jgi:hypothetical protein